MRPLACVLVAVSLSGPAAAQSSTSGDAAGRCRAAGADFALGQTYSDRLARRARRGAGAREVRKLEPGRVYTMDYRVDRLNLDVDRRGNVRAVRCG